MASTWASPTFYPGVQNFPLSGDVDDGDQRPRRPGERHRALDRAGADRGSRRLEAGCQFSTRMSLLARRCRPGSQKLIVRGVDADGTVGPSQHVRARPSTRPLPAGALVITLTGTPRPTSTSTRRPDRPERPLTGRRRSRGRDLGEGPRRPAAGPPATTRPSGRDGRAAYLDFDSNADCVIDGRRQENIIFPNAAARRASTSCASTPSRCAARPRRSGRSTVDHARRRRREPRDVAGDGRRHARRPRRRRRAGWRWISRFEDG